MANNTLKKLKYDNKECQVESAIRDGAGNVITSTYSTTSHTHTASLATDSGTSAITLSHGGKYKLTAGGSSVIFTMPSATDYTKISVGQGVYATYVSYDSSDGAIVFGNQSYDTYLNYYGGQIDVSDIADAVSAVSGKAPKSHASSATTYGVGTTSNYGHVKLATGDMNGASNADGVACSKNHTHSQYLTSVPNLNASKITSGTFDVARIPSLAASKITTGTFGSAMLLNAYPVGSIYISAVNTSPAGTLGGTWTQLSTMYIPAVTSIPVKTGIRHDGNATQLNFDYISGSSTIQCNTQSKNFALASNGIGLTISQLDGSSWGSNWGGWGTIIPNNLYATQGSYITVYAWQRTA